MSSVSCATCSVRVPAREGARPSTPRARRCCRSQMHKLYKIKRAQRFDLVST